MLSLKEEIAIQASGKRAAAAATRAMKVQTAVRVFLRLLTDATEIISFPGYSSWDFSEPISLNTTLDRAPMTIIISSAAAMV